MHMCTPCLLRLCFIAALHAALHTALHAGPAHNPKRPPLPPAHRELHKANCRIKRQIYFEEVEGMTADDIRRGKMNGATDGELQLLARFRQPDSDDAVKAAYAAYLAAKAAAASADGAVGDDAADEPPLQLPASLAAILKKPTAFQLELQTKGAHALSSFGGVEVRRCGRG